MFSCSSISFNIGTGTYIELYTHIQSISLDDGRKLDFKDSLIIFSDNNYVIYKRPFIKFFFHQNLVQGTDTINQTVANHIVKYHYFIYNKKSSYGYFYDSINSVKPKRIFVDSVEHELIMKGFPFYSDRDILIYSNRRNNKSYFLEKRVPTNKTDDTFPDSSYYYYNNKFLKSPFSFSEKLDSLSDSKLYKIRFLYNFIGKGKYSFDIPHHEFYFELRNVQNPVEIPKLIERFKSFESQITNNRIKM